MLMPSSCEFVGGRRGGGGGGGGQGDSVGVRPGS